MSTDVCSLGSTVKPVAPADTDLDNEPLKQTGKQIKEALLQMRMHLTEALIGSMVNINHASSNFASTSHSFLQSDEMECVSSVPQ